MRRANNIMNTLTCTIAYFRIISVYVCSLTYGFYNNYNTFINSKENKNIE